MAAYPESGVIPDHYQPGVVAEGRVVQLAPFGAFLEFERGVIGLMLVPETLAGRGQLPSDVLALGDTVKVRVVQVLEGRRKMTVSQRALT